MLRCQGSESEASICPMSQPDRRYEVAAAAWRVIVREGLDRTSLRAIAHELGCTTGVVTHHFRDKQALMLFALDQVTQRLTTGMAVLQREKMLERERLVAMLLTFLPQDTERQEILRVWVAFLGHAIGHPALMAAHQRSAAQLRAVVIDELRALQQAQQIRPAVNPAVEANVLLALVNGLGIDALIQAQCLDSQQQAQAIRQYVESLR